MTNTQAVVDAMEAKTAAALDEKLANDAYTATSLRLDNALARGTASADQRAALRRTIQNLKNLWLDAVAVRETASDVLASVLHL